MGDYRVTFRIDRPWEFTPFSLIYFVVLVARGEPDLNASIVSADAGPVVGAENVIVRNRCIHI